MFFPTPTLLASSTASEVLMLPEFLAGIVDRIIVRARLFHMRGTALLMHYKQ